MLARTLVVGGDSRIGRALAQLLCRCSTEEPVVVTTRRTEPRVDPLPCGYLHLDLLYPHLPVDDWTTIYLVAAVTGFGACEAAPVNSWRVNADAPAQLALQAHQSSSVPPHVIFVSSSAVEMASGTAYGRQKAYAECCVLAAGGTIARLGFVSDADLDAAVRFLADARNGRRGGLIRWP